MNGTESVGAPPPPVKDGGGNAPNTEAWNSQVDQALGETGTSLIGGIVVRMTNATKANGEEDG